MRRLLLALGALATMVVVAALSVPRGQTELLVLNWASKARVEKPPVAILIEMGLKDRRTRDWSGRAQVVGAKVVHREGYRFRSEDRLTGTDGWRATSHRGMRNPRGPLAFRREIIGTVGVVLHLTEAREDGALTLEPNDKGLSKATVVLRDVLANRPQKLWDGQAVVRLVSTATPVAVGRTEDDFPAACYGPDGTLWVAYVSYTPQNKDVVLESPVYTKKPPGFKHLDQPEFGDQLRVKYLRAGRWSESLALTGPHESITRCAVAAEGGGDVWVAYSASRQGVHRLFARRLRGRVARGAGVEGPPQVGPELELGPKDRLPAVACVLATDQLGRVHLAGQAASGDGPAGKRFHTLTGTFRDGKFEIGPASTVAGTHWTHALAPAADGKMALGFDLYGPGGSYDVYVATDRQADPLQGRYVAQSAKFEGRPSLAYDPKGRLWIAYEEAPPGWGKDFGLFRRRWGGVDLYFDRWVRVVCLQDGQLMRPAATLPVGGLAPRPRVVTTYSYPQIGIDGKGRVWLTYQEQNRAKYTSTAPGPYWLTFARRLDGDHWTEPIEIHHGDGLLDSRPVLLPHKSGGLLAIHSSDDRFTKPEALRSHVYMSYLDLPGAPVEPKLVPQAPGEHPPGAEAKREAEAIRRMRGYRVEARGKQYRLVRGEFHRHTAISFDGARDGSLEDMFRYALDAADLDWVGNGDHDSGAGREYSWWLIQKFTDAYHLPGQFTTMFSYERSVRYPNGHRNCLFARRGVLPLPRLAYGRGNFVADVRPDDTKMLYQYLKELDGVCASHTSATYAGTDWRDNDPAAEPIVEVYQGQRMSYEYQGAPRTGRDPLSGLRPAQIGGWRPLGFVDRALRKGYRLGFQASSDHTSTHMSYFVALVEKAGRANLLEAARRRHCYGATDNILVDVRSGSHLMGDEFKTTEAPALQMTVLGSGQLAKIDVLRDSAVIATLKPDGLRYRGTWTDPAPQPGTHYYYVRVLQEDGELAWASPMWITRP
jgi:hypothetical protein